MAKTLVYQMYPISWGAIRMMTLMLTRVAALGADYVLLSPIFTSPWKNHGYDVADYYTVEPRLGTMADFDEFVRAAHAIGLKVILDLPIDSTSTEHGWFKVEPHRYIWNNNGNPLKQSMTHGPAWQADNGEYYLTLNHPSQATLNWFSNGVLNRGLIECFRKIMCFWLFDHGVDGFRLENIQLINDVSPIDTKLTDILTGQRSVKVVNELANLYGSKSPFLILDVIDPDCGTVTDYYARETDVEFITNRVLKSTVAYKSKAPFAGLKKKVDAQAKSRRFMLDLESHDAPRFTSRAGADPVDVLEFMFTSNAEAICLYQGQELGLLNPENLSMLEILSLDSKTEFQHIKNQASFESLCQNSCANARVPIPLDEYASQESQPNSVLANAIALVQKWKHY